MKQAINYKRHYKELIYLGVPIIIGQIGTIILGFDDRTSQCQRTVCCRICQ